MPISLSPQDHFDPADHQNLSFSMEKLKIKLGSLTKLGLLLQGMVNKSHPSTGFQTCWGSAR